MLTNSPRVRYPVPYAHVMGEKPTVAKRPLDGRPIGRVRLLPTKLGRNTDRKAYRRPHAHMVAECGHTAMCDHASVVAELGCPALAGSRPTCRACEPTQPIVMVTLARRPTALRLDVPERKGTLKGGRQKLVGPSFTDRKKKVGPRIDPIKSAKELVGIDQREITLETPWEEVGTLASAPIIDRPRRCLKHTTCACQ